MGFLQILSTKSSSPLRSGPRAPRENLPSLAKYVLVNDSDVLRVNFQRQTITPQPTGKESSFVFTIMIS